MSFREKLTTELKILLVTALFFMVWFVFLVTLKTFILDDYQIKFRGFSVAIIGALIVAKVVLVLEHVSLGEWVRNHPAVIDVVSRTILYTFGVAVALLLEKGFEARHEAGGFIPGMKHVFHSRDIYHVYANLLVVACALLVFNILGVLRRRLGDRQLVRLFFSVPLRELKADSEGANRD